ncbi:release factor glutamine methyltransferase [Sinomonas cyclohexanicum]|uniref:Release factor glutamine methyltransferase n=1 Tax=Sinomonas cyclohexanicum TaxID=322009 RepID=A0ABN6FLK2_SINCY|nr:HemK/PrmC family methyltransferase [Corynebacterium cyclohexanicum]BCT76688.1 release factor glutamine methyltransferase [Corynebacterium cyclohexanicum]
MSAPAGPGPEAPRPEDLGTALRRAAAVLAEAGCPSPRVDAEILAEHVLARDPSSPLGGGGLGRLRALAITGATAPEGFADAFWELVAERGRRVPLQHLTGTAHFRHLTLAVGPGVFVPRPETEGVVQVALDWIAEHFPGAVAGPGSDTAHDAGHPPSAAGSPRAPRARRAAGPVVVDLGTGSGAIAASIAQEVPGAVVHAVELSELAHAWAARNAALPEVGGRVHLALGDLRTAFRELDGTVDVVVSNPPYIPPEMVPREPEAALHDPEMALYGGADGGLELPLAAAVTAARLLRPGGFFVMEHAEVQAARIAELLAADPAWSGVRSHEDLNGLPRATSAVRA